MAITKKPGRNRVRSANPELNGSPSSDEVLTLAEAAAYLRIGEEAVLRLIEKQGLPARQVDAEWRLLKPAIQRWLGRETIDTSKAAQLAVVGSWKDDPYVDQELKETYERRRASRTEERS
jgi:excisionase family DNA binding protein